MKKKIRQYVVKSDTGIMEIFENNIDAVKFIDDHKGVKFKLIARDINEFEVTDDVIDTIRKFLM